MEFKLNKIDTDIRRKLQEQNKEDRVHSSKSINVKKDLVKEKKHLDEREEQRKKREGDTKEKNKNTITVDGVRYNEQSVYIDVEKTEKISEENSKGRILDAKK